LAKAETDFFPTTSATLDTWSIPEEDLITTQGKNPRNGIVRYYDPLTGRFISKDPIGISGGINEYLYAGGNPVCWTDSSGLCTGGDDAYAGMSPGVAWFYGNIFDPFYHHNGLGRQMLSIGYAGGSAVNWLLWRDNAAREYMNHAMANSGQAIMHETGAGTGWYAAYWGSLGVSAAADAVAAGPMVGRAIVREIGAKAFSNGQWGRLGLEGLSNYEKGLILIKEQGLLRATLPTAQGLVLGIGSKAFSEGPTLAAKVLGPLAVDIAVRLVHGRIAN
jgi:hypothetical protein